jgi:hypothetical protein
MRSRVTENYLPDFFLRVIVFTLMRDGWERVLNLTHIKWVGRPLLRRLQPRAIGPFVAMLIRLLGALARRARHRALGRLRRGLCCGLAFRLQGFNSHVSVLPMQD